MIADPADLPEYHRGACPVCAAVCEQRRRAVLLPDRTKHVALDCIECEMVYVVAVPAIAAEKLAAPPSVGNIAKVIAALDATLTDEPEEPRCKCGELESYWAHDLEMRGSRVVRTELVHDFEPEDDHG